MDISTIIIILNLLALIIVASFFVYRKRKSMMNRPGMRPEKSVAKQVVLGSQNVCQKGSSVSQERLLDAAIARNVVIGEPAELIAQVRLKSSTGLKGILELDIDYDPRPEDVKSRSVQLEFPLDENQKLQGIFLLLKVSSHDFKPPAQTKKIIVPPDADSEPCVFQLTPLRVGQLGILLEVYDTGEVVTASTKIRVNCQESQATAIDPENRILVSLPLATTVRPFGETKQEALQKRWEELVEEYEAVMAQIGYETNSVNKLKLERQANVLSQEIARVQKQRRQDIPPTKELVTEKKTQMIVDDDQTLRRKVTESSNAAYQWRVLDEPEFIDWLRNVVRSDIIDWPRILEESDVKDKIDVYQTRKALVTLGSAAIENKPFHWTSQTLKLIFQVRSFIIAWIHTLQNDAAPRQKQQQRMNQMRGQPTLKQLRKMDPIDFEYWTAAYFQQFDFENITVITSAADFGIDFIMTTPKGQKAIVQCKRYSRSNSIGRPTIQQTYGIMKLLGAEICYIVTTGRYTPPALELNKRRDIVLLDGDFLVSGKRPIG